MHTIVNVTANGLRRNGTYSDASAAEFGIAPPRPSPAKKRSTVSMVTLAANDASTVNTPKVTTLVSSARRRPMRSPRYPPTNPPNTMPRSAAASTDANAGRGSAHSRIIAGIAAPSN